MFKGGKYLLAHNWKNMHKNPDACGASFKGAGIIVMGNEE